MSDPIKDLENFGTEGTPMNPLPPSEVRRRGDRLRRRRNALTATGSALAVAVIAGGGIWFSGSMDQAEEPGPATGRPSESTSQSAEQPAEIPDDFPIGAQINGAQISDKALNSDLDFCSQQPLRGVQAADVRSAELSGGETAETRTLYLFDDEASARELHEAVVEAALECADPDPRDGSTVSVWDTNLEDWPGNTIVHEYAEEPTSEPSTQIINVVTKGSAVLVTSSFGAWFDDQQSGVSMSRDDANAVITAMDEFGEVPGGLPVPHQVTGAP